MKQIQAYTHIGKDLQAHISKKVLFSGQNTPSEMERVDITPENLTGRYKENVNYNGHTIMLIEIKHIIIETKRIVKVIKGGLFKFPKTETTDVEENKSILIWIPEDYIHFETTFICGK